MTFTEGTRLIPVVQCINSRDSKESNDTKRKNSPHMYPQGGCGVEKAAILGSAQAIVEVVRGDQI